MGTGKEGEGDEGGEGNKEEMEQNHPFNERMGT